MSVCAVAVAQGDGSFLLGLDPSITDLSACAYVVQTGSDFGLTQLLNLSVPDALLLSSLVSGVWVAAWAIRMLIQVLRGNENEDSN